MTSNKPRTYFLRTRTQSMLADHYDTVPHPKVSECALCSLALTHHSPERILLEYFMNQFLEQERKMVKRKVRPNIKAVSAYRAYRNAKMASLKKMASVCARELRRALMRTGKTNPCLKGRRSGKGFNALTRGKKMKRKGEKEKKREDRKEEEREQRKLNYLINQTELYAHFVLRGEHERLKKTKLEWNDDDGAMKEMDEQLAQFKQEEKKMESGGNETMTIKNITRTQTVPVLKHFKANLKEYQAKGVCWLINLYNQGINGILADDMGLGKTVQTLAFLTYLAEHHNKRLFLIVTPASTLHNWETEIKRFNSNFKINLYIGTDRNVSIRRIPQPLIVLTSYQLIADRKLKRIKYDYLVCDEAQAIKSNKSRRWKNINELRCNNRLLLTGTPIQNSMQELWSLLHFIMPGLFDSHTLFLSWFSNEKSVKKEGLERLHSILKPFMLRREKKDVKNELGTKTEKDVICIMTPLQHALYERVNKEKESENMMMQLRKIVNHPELFMHRENGTGLYCGKDKHVLHLSRRSKSMYRTCLEMMLNEVKTVNSMYGNIRGIKSNDNRRDSTNDLHSNVSTSTASNSCERHSHPANLNYHFVGYKNNGAVSGGVYDSYVEDMSSNGDNNEIDYNNNNNDNNNNDNNNISTISANTPHINSDLVLKRKVEQKNDRDVFKRVRLPDYVEDCTYGISKCCSKDLVRRYTKSDVHLNYLEGLETYSPMHSNRCMVERINGMGVKRCKYNQVNKEFYYTMGGTYEVVTESKYYEKEYNKENTRINVDKNKESGKGVGRGNGRKGKRKNDGNDMVKEIDEDTNGRDGDERIKIPTSSLIKDCKRYGCTEEGKDGDIVEIEGKNQHVRLMNDERVKTGADCKNGVNTNDQIVEIKRCAGANKNYYDHKMMNMLLDDLNYEQFKFLRWNRLLYAQRLYFRGVVCNLVRRAFCSVVNNNNYVMVPEINLVKESGKLIVLDSMLKQMIGRRVLIYFQMTKMIDLFEEYVKMNNYSYVRLDGGVKVSERKRIVNKFQTEDIFLFLLSTRAGGLGINLTKANTVIFYDSDWNPTVDLQAMDRAYRLGNTEDVVVYRLVTANSIEEKMRITAGMKEEIHRLVIDGGEFTL
ncbi:SNF2 family DNA-dependent ATPase [Trachipleistophora hominis]|uniref:Chromatin-remodeling ATPase INO80 n=1 Tax=Trachipleistophora hominis TaxID=72359 RepID=L7JWM0_TRAHO|nr:SNF2 family DNA-dependent ATPase [Trachipleistophora hominis]